MLILAYFPIPTRNVFEFKINETNERKTKTYGNSALITETQFILTDK